MAEALELTPAEEAELKADLLLLESQLTELVSALKGSAEIVDLDQPIGRLSRMAAIQQQHMSQANQRSTELRLKQIAQALQTLADGDYGLCRKCEEPVGFRRLKARPEAAFCVGCQSGREA